MNRSRPTPTLITQVSSYVAPSNLLIVGAFVAICHQPSSAAVGLTDVAAYTDPNVLGPALGAHRAHLAEVMIAM